MNRVAPATLFLLMCLTASAAAQTPSTPEATPPEVQQPAVPSADTPPSAQAPANAVPTDATPANPPPTNTPPANASGSKPATPPQAANLETLAIGDARDILGQKVSGAAGEDMGLVVDVLFDANKQPRAVVIDFGGFLGVGTRKIAVDWKLLQFYAPDAKTPLKLDLSRADVQNAPEYKPSDKSIRVIAGPSPTQMAAPAQTAPPSPSTPPASPPSPSTSPASTPPTGTPPAATTPPASPPSAPAAPATTAH
ncbi:MAG TPA: PRC-barrel domain-containing protein [Stellaceae bacterium]|jgi:hypothetical protein|nr:PRC-barrel domain-containing protein [Stellaceae bacterium]